MKTAIVLGAGLAGLSAAWKLADAGFYVTVVERDAQVGGLAKTLRLKDHSCDLGPHRFITRDKHLFHKVETLISKGLLLRKQRKSKIWIGGRYIEYPPNLKDVLLNFNALLSLAIAGDYFFTFVRNRISPRPDDSFENWVINRFGRSFYNIYFRDYTAKLWHMPPSEISTDWASQRISMVNLSDVLARLFGKKGKALRTYATGFYYPASGTGAIAEAMAERIIKKGGRVYLNSPVENITAQRGKVKSVTVNKNRERSLRLKADCVVSTIPLGGLACMLTDNMGVVNAAAGLKVMSLAFLFLLIRKPRVSNIHWFYFPERKYSFNRISEIKNFSSTMAPTGRTSLCVEITCNKGDAIWNADAGGLFDKLKNELFDIGLIGPGEVDDVFLHREEHAYPVYDRGYAGNLKAVLKYVNSFNNLVTIGRQGLFRYNNMDHSMGMGFEAAAYLSKKGSRRKIFNIGVKSRYFG